MTNAVLLDGIVRNLVRNAIEYTPDSRRILLACRPPAKRSIRATIDQATIDLEIDFVHMPSRMRLRPAFAKIGRDLGAKMVRPSPSGAPSHRKPRFHVLPTNPQRH
jgi:hypothetical protein